MIYRTLAFILGFTCFIVQMVMLREFMSLFMGNELVIAIVLGLWMLLTAAGAWAGKYLSIPAWNSRPIFSMLLISGAGPLLGIFLTLWIRSQFYTPGVMISLQGSIWLSMSGLMIFCFASGIMFTLLATLLANTEGKKGIAGIYAVEALGSLAGGLVFNFIIIYTLGSMYTLILVAGVNILAATVFSFLTRKPLMAALGALSLSALLAGSFIADPEQAAASLTFPGMEVIMTRDTPYGKLAATKNWGQTDLYLNGQVLASSGDLINREEKVHYAMCLHPGPGNVLMIMGGLDGSPEEVIKYGPAVIDYVDMDPWSIQYADQLGISRWPNGMGIYCTDPLLFLRERAYKYDVILFNGPLPGTIGNNRLYTREFFHAVKDHLNSGGIISTPLPHAGNYMGNETKMLYSSIYRTLMAEFRYVRIIPGEKTYFIASDEPPGGHITERISALGILTDYVNQYYLDDSLMAGRAGKIGEQLDANARVNTVSRPIAAHLSLLAWLGMQQLPMIPIIALPLILMGIIIFKMSRYNIGLFATGFTASSGEFLLLIAFQILYGFIYQMAGLIIMIFMAGLFAGSGFLFRFAGERRRSFICIQAIIGLSVLLIPLTMQLNIGGWSPGLLIGSLTFLLAVLTGIQYKLATLLRPGNIGEIAASTYGADLAGSAFGVFFMGVFVFPLIGMMNTVIVLAVANIFIATIIHLKKA